MANQRVSNKQILEALQGLVARVEALEAKPIAHSAAVPVAAPKATKGGGVVGAKVRAVVAKAKPWAKEKGCEVRVYHLTTPNNKHGYVRFFRETSRAPDNGSLVCVVSSKGAVTDVQPYYKAMLEAK